MAIKAKSKDKHKIHCWEVIHKYESKEKNLKGMNQLIAKSLRITNKLEKLNVLTSDELDCINYMTDEYLAQVQINYLIHAKTNIHI